jgi:hypothetical protein
MQEATLHVNTPNGTTDSDFIVAAQLSVSQLQISDQTISPVAARSKAWVRGLSLGGIVGSNHVVDMEVYLS